MNIAIRVEASIKIGMGHWMRCQALKQMLAKQGHQVLLLVGREASGLVDARENEIFWLERPLDLEYEQHVVDKLPVKLDWLIVDHYGLDHRFETAMRKRISRIMVIDDLANRRHDCEILLDQNFYLQPEARYKGLIPAEAKCFLGPRFALLREQFFTHRKSAFFSKKPEKILINFGGSDSAGMTLRTLEALQDLSGLLQVCVAGHANPEIAAIARFCQQRSNIRFQSHVTNMAELMVESDLAIGAGGISHWERMITGLPAIVIAVADNQVESSRDLDQAGAIQYLGKSDEIDDADLVHATRTLLQYPEELQKMVEKGLEIMGDVQITRYNPLIQCLQGGIQ